MQPFELVRSPKYMLDLEDADRFLIDKIIFE